MRTIYIYLSWTGWIWLVISGTYLFIQLRKRRMMKFRPGFPVTAIPDKTDAMKNTEAGKPNE